MPLEQTQEMTQELDLGLQQLLTAELQTYFDMVAEQQALTDAIEAQKTNIASMLEDQGITKARIGDQYATYVPEGKQKRLDKRVLMEKFGVTAKQLEAATRETPRKAYWLLGQGEEKKERGNDGE